MDKYKIYFFLFLPDCVLCATQGNIHLENVRLRETALAALDLPVDVSFGLVKQISIKIPWTALTKKPTIVSIDGIYALIRNRTDFDGDEVTKEEIARKLHLRTMEGFEKILSDAAERDKELVKNKGKLKQDGADAVISSKFLMSIVDNLQVSIRNIHIRYVDETSFIGHRCAIGFAIQEIMVYPYDRKRKRKVPPDQHVQFRQVMIAFYQKFDITKTETQVDLILKRWKNKEDVLFDNLEVRYGTRPPFQLDLRSKAMNNSPRNSGSSPQKGPKFLLKKFEITNILLYIDPNVGEEAMRFEKWDNVENFCDVMRLVFDNDNVTVLNATGHENHTKYNSVDIDASMHQPLRHTIETANHRVGYVSSSTYVLNPLHLAVSFKSYKTTANRDLPLFDICIGGGRRGSTNLSNHNGSNGDVDVPTLSLQITPDQFGALAAITDSLTNYRKYSKLRSWRPKQTRPKSDARGWWRYIIHAVILQVRDHLGTRSWIRLTELLRVRRKYIKLYQEKVQQKRTSKKTSVDIELEELDACLSTRYAKYFRTVVRRDEKKTADA